MTNKKPLILVTNDDGYQSKGIQSLIESVIGLGQIVVLAPDGPRSGMSSAISSVQPLRYSLVQKDESKDLAVYACTGTPVDCVKLAINELLDRKPDLLVSGVNHGSNAAICVVYSGTMGAAIEGCIFGVPSIGFSVTDHSANADFQETIKIARLISMQVLEEGLPEGVCLNVNVPDVSPVKGIKVCRQTKGQWIKEFVRSKDGAQREVFWLTGEFSNDEPNDQNTDEWALAQGYASIVPTKIDMTAHEVIAKIKNWENLL
jgi:5'-nucleotidase